MKLSEDASRDRNIVKEIIKLQLENRVLKAEKAELIEWLKKITNDSKGSPWFEGKRELAKEILKYLGVED